MSGLYPRKSVEDLLCLDLSAVRKMLKRDGYSFSQFEGRTESGYLGSLDLNWTRSNRYTDKIQRLGNIRLRFGKEINTLFLDLLYTITDPEDGTKTPVETRYYLEKRESNLKSGSYRYYIRDPYSEEGRLCTKLYLLDGYFLPRSVLETYRVRYRQQRQGHTERYVWTYYHRVPGSEDIKYRKSHYRGVETPYWRRYNHLCEEGDRRVLAYLIYKNESEYADLIGSNRY